MTYDGPDIFRAPYGNDAALDNFQRTVLTGVPVEEVGPHTNFGISEDTVHLWGTKETVKGSWDNVSAGDFLFFYRDGTYEYAAEVLGTEENETLGREIWPNYEADSPWVCIIYLDEPVELGISSSEVHGLAGYDIDYPMGFSPLNEMGIGGIRGKYGSVESLVYGSESSDIDLTATPNISIPDEVLDGLHFPEDSDTTAESIVDQAESALNAGKHLIFTGPPGTGKTEIALQISKYLSENNPTTYSGYRTTTATADWSTFDTVGGYMPDGNTGESLDFEAGQVLRCFKQNESQRNDILIIDEINRSDIDKSFGQLFTLLSGQGIQLPFSRDGKPVEVQHYTGQNGNPAPNEYIVPPSWRLLATMNSYDKTSLYEMSYAFMRRFAFIHIDAPVVPSDADQRVEFLEQYENAWDLSIEDNVSRAVGAVWYVTNTVAAERKLGPAIAKDLLKHISNSEASLQRATTQAISSYVFPQLEGVRRRERVVKELSQLEQVDTQQLRRLGREILRVELDE